MKKLLVLLTAVAMLFAFTATASAAEFSFYGNARLQTFSWEDSKEINRIPHVDTSAGQTPAAVTAGDAFDESDRDLDVSLSAISRFGTKITISDELTANLELGLKGSDNDNEVYVRHYYGEYDFGAGKILVGQYWHPFAVEVSYSNQVGNTDDGLGSIGAFTASRRAQVRLSFGDFALHFMRPDTKAISGIADGYVGGYTGATAIGVDADKYADYDVSWPHVAAVYKTKYENFNFDIAGAFQSYEVSNTRPSTYYDVRANAQLTDGSTSYDVDSHALKVGIKGNFGLFTLGATYGFGQNLANMGVDAASTKGSNGANATPAAFYRAARAMDGTFLHDGVSAIGDVDTTAYTIVGAFKVNDMVTLEAGYGKVSNDIATKAQDDESRLYYLQAAITVADGFTVTPEIGKYDYEEDSSGNDEGDATYFGAKWQINF